MRSFATQSAVRGPSGESTRLRGGEARPSTLSSPILQRPIDLSPPSLTFAPTPDPAPMEAPEEPRAIAESGFREAARPLPFRRELERSFGVPLGDLEAFTGGAARKACARLGAEGYALGHRLSFASASPRHEVVAHEVTHALQYARGDDRGGGGVFTGGEAEADAAARAVTRGDAPVVPRPTLPLRAANAARPALQGFPASRGFGSEKPTPGRLTTNASATGAGTTVEWQLTGLPPPKVVIIPPWLYGQLIPEIKFLGKFATLYGGPMAGTTQAQATVSTRAILLLSAGVVQVAEVFGSLTGQLDGNAAIYAGGREPQVVLEAVARLSGRVGARVGRRSLEWSVDLFNFEIAKARLRFQKTEAGWGLASSDIDWGEDAKRLGAALQSCIDAAGSYVDEKEVEAGGWLQRNVEEPIKRYLTPNVRW